MARKKLILEVLGVKMSEKKCRRFKILVDFLKTTILPPLSKHHTQTHVNESKKGRKSNFTNLIFIDERETILAVIQFVSIREIDNQYCIEDNN